MNSLKNLYNHTVSSPNEIDCTNGLSNWLPKTSDQLFFGINRDFEVVCYTKQELIDKYYAGEEP